MISMKSLTNWRHAERSNGRDGSQSHNGVNNPPVDVGGGKIVTPNLRIFTVDELKSATRNFRPDTVLGEGGFGRVFRGWIDPNTFKPSKVGVGIPVAVKKSNPDSLQGLQEWQVRNSFVLVLLFLINSSKTFLSYGVYIVLPSMYPFDFNKYKYLPKR